MGTPLDSLSTSELAAVNKRYGWLCGTRDSKGRVLGNKDKVFDIPDWKVSAAIRHLGLAGKGVVEFGCCEGAHTVALCQAADHVTGLEGRPENVEKTLVRLRLYGQDAHVLRADLETELPPAADLFFHSGVLYHLQDPVGHLRRIAPLAPELFLDTHYVKTPNGHYRCGVDGQEYPCWLFGETVKHPKAGLRSFARWLPLDSLLGVLNDLFSDVEVIRYPQERNGPRVSIVARRKPS